MPERQFDAVIFDMDGVLVDSGDVYGRHWAAWAQDHGVDPATIRNVHPGRPAGSTISLVAPQLDAVAEAVRFNAALAAEDASAEVSALPGAAELTGALPAGRWTIATSALRAIAQHWLRSVGIPVPAELVSVDDVERGKPWPDSYLKAAQLLGVDPGRCLVIEDAPAGISAAKAAGATVLALRTTHLAHELAEADASAADLSVIVIDAGDARLRVSWPDGAASARR